MGRQLRSAIDEMTTGKLRIRTLVSGIAWLVPSSTELGAFYLVVRSRRFGWVCCCRAVRFGSRSDESCQHVDRVKQKLERKGKRAKRT